MPNHSSKEPKRPRDINQLAKLVVDMATGQVPSDTVVVSARVPNAKLPEREKDPAAVALGRKGGLKGGKARADKLTKEQRSEAARNAANARWRKPES